VSHDENNQNEKPPEVKSAQFKLEKGAPKKLRKPTDLLAKTLLDAIEFRPSLFGIGINIHRLFNGRAKVGRRNLLAEDRKSVEERKIDVVKQLLESDIDPGLFDVLLQNEVDRRLKIRFGVTFLVLTFLFTTASYAIVILDGVFKWNISEFAITALIIETPIQFIGLLYIIARNLFPQTNGKNTNQKRTQRNTEQGHGDGL